VDQRRHGPLCVELHLAARRQGPGLDPGAVSRGARARDGFEGLTAIRLSTAPALDAGGCVAQRNGLIARFPPFSEEREQFSAALYGTSEVLKVDGEGRAILTEPLKTHAGIKDEITCAGLGHKFQIWDPGRFRAELAEATEKVRAPTRQLACRVSAEADGPGIRRAATARALSRRTGSRHIPCSAAHG
jgi:MraZ protein